MPTYDYRCMSKDCTNVQVEFRTYEKREDLGICYKCGVNTKRCYATPPQVRTEKLSRTFIDKTSAGGGRPDKGWEDEKIAAKLQEDALKVSHKSDEYKQIKKEIKERRKLKK